LRLFSGNNGFTFKLLDFDNKVRKKRFCHCLGLLEASLSAFKRQTMLSNIGAARGGQIEQA